MSAKQVSLKSPVTIAVVTVLLVGVVFLNLNTFGGKGGKTSRGYRVQAHPPVPMDVRQLVSCETNFQGAGRASAISMENLERDPFFPDQTQPVSVMASTVRRSSKRSQRKPKAKPLECSAIMLGGVQPMAIISGEGRHPGDKIRGMVLSAIDADGVTFIKANGSSFRLPVGVQEDNKDSFRVVTRVQNTDEQGRTRLVDQ